jgi:phage RecT family recombinase
MTTETKAVEKKQDAKLTPADSKMLEVFSIMERRKGRFEDLLPPWMPPERFVAGAKMAMSLTPDLTQCTPESLLTALYKAARAGIDVSGGFLGHGALVKFGNEATFVPMVRGIIALAVATGVVQDMTPILVYSNDVFDPEEGDNPRIIHRPFVPKKAGDKRGDIIAAYTRVMLPSGKTIVKGLLYLDDILKVESGVRAKNGPWSTHRPEMIKKTTVKNAAKSVGTPSSDQAQYLNAALQADAEADGYDVEGTVVSSAPVARGTASLRALAAGRRAETLESSPVPDSVPASPPEPGSEG